MDQQSNTISTKDLSYFSDMFNWNLNCYNAFSHFSSEIQEEETKQIIDEVALMHKEACEYILGLIQE
ncbi:MAG: hypothetical protein IJO32_03250 [Bacilli bacterium]|nr:hypothetical protein [Bacilli bacterium]